MSTLEIGVVEFKQPECLADSQYLFTHSMRVSQSLEKRYLQSKWTTFTTVL